MTETIIYSALISKYSYYEKLGKLFEDEWFYCTYDDLQESTTFPGKVQKKAIDHLVELGLVKSMVFGMPAKRYMTISDNVDLLEKLLDAGIDKARELTRKSLDKQREYIGATCSADLAYKSKDNKTKAEESKGNQSIYPGKENVYYSYQYIKK